MQEITVLDGLFKILFAVRQVPGMFLRKKSVFYLENFIRGLSTGFTLDGRQNHQLKQELDLLHQFDLFLQQKYFYGSALNGYSGLYYQCDENEERAFDLFFQELELYLNQNVPRGTFFQEGVKHDNS